MLALPMPSRINLCVCYRGRCFAWDRRVCVEERFFEIPPPFGGHAQMEHATFADLAAICLKRFEARGGEVREPASVSLATCHCKEVFLVQSLDTRVRTEVVIRMRRRTLGTSHNSTDDCDTDVVHMFYSTKEKGEQGRH